MKIMVEFFLIAEDFPIKEVYDKIGLEGSLERLDEARFRTLSNESYIREKECSITYSTGYVDTIDAGEPIEQIINLLHSHEEQIVECIKKYRLESKFCIVVNLTDNPIVRMSKNFIDLASRLQADIEFDSYVDCNRMGIFARLSSWFHKKRNK